MSVSEREWLRSEWFQVSSRAGRRRKGGRRREPKNSEREGGSTKKDGQDGRDDEDWGRIGTGAGASVSASTKKGERGES